MILRFLPRMKKNPKHTNEDMRLKFGIEKCAMKMKKKNVKREGTKGIKLLY